MISEIEFNVLSAASFLSKMNHIVFRLIAMEKKEMLLTVFCSIVVAHCQSIPDPRCQIRYSSTGSLGKDQLVFFLILTF